MSDCACGCGKPIEPKPHHKWRGTPLYLRSHNPASKPKPRVPWVIINGYRCFLSEDRRPNGRRRYVYEHRTVMEQKLGRPLAKGEVVHHRDHNRLNNDPSNLELLDRFTHGHEHHKAGRDARSHVHKHFDCECGQSTGLSEQWHERNREQRARDLTRDASGRIAKR